MCDKITEIFIETFNHTTERRSSTTKPLKLRCDRLEMSFIVNSIYCLANGASIWFSLSTTCFCCCLPFGSMCLCVYIVHCFCCRSLIRKIYEVTFDVNLNRFTLTRPFSQNVDVFRQTWSKKPSFGFFFLASGNSHWLSYFRDTSTLFWHVSCTAHRSHSHA